MWRISFIAWLGLFILSLFALPDPAHAGTLIIQGSTTFARHLLDNKTAEIEAASGQKLTVIPNKSVPGLIALQEGRADIAMISAPLENELRSSNAMDQLASTKFRVHEIARVRVAIVVNPANKVRAATADQVTKILNGEIKNWSELGGDDLPIRVVLVGEGGGLTLMVERELLGSRPPKAQNVLFVKTPVQLVKIVGQEPGYLGFAQLDLAKQQQMPELKVEHPIEQILSLVTLGEPTKQMQAVIDAARRVSASPNN